MTTSTGGTGSTDCIVVLDRPKTPDNVGTVFRSALALGAQTVILCAPRWPNAVRGLDKLRTDPSCAYRHLRVHVVPTLATALSFAPYNAVVVVERGLGLAFPVYLDQFIHPVTATYVFGPEDGSVDWGDLAAQAVEIRGALPLAHPKQGCLNLATSVSLVLYDRAAKMLAGTTTGHAVRCGVDHKRHS